MILKIKALCEALEKTPHDIYAFLLIMTGSTLVLCGHKDEGMQIAIAGLAVFKGK